ncbi:MAG: PfkB family carbohydrate kinase [Desulfurococcales archaeon]|nr:PfkB family carbohydrate kinase [Desulfurococcales archaeon]
MVPPRLAQEHVAVGNINLDITVRVPRLPGPEENVKASEYWIGLGGAATNYAVATARLGQRARLVAVAGREAERLGLLDALRREGVDIGGVRVSGEPTGIVIVLLSPGRGEEARSMVTMRGANLLLEPSMVPEGGDVVHLASVRPGLVGEVCEGRALCTYDPGGESFHNPEGVASAAGMAHYLMLNLRELEAITGGGGVEAATSLVSGRLRLVVVKYGSGGAALVDASGVVAEARPPRLGRPVDVTGAGDAFDAAFNVWLLWRGDPLEALRAAVAAGAAKVGRRGSSNMPGPDEVASLAARVEVSGAWRRAG